MKGNLVWQPSGFPGIPPGNFIFKMSASPLPERGNGVWTFKLLTRTRSVLECASPLALWDANEVSMRSYTNDLRASLVKAVEGYSIPKRFASGLMSRNVQFSRPSPFWRGQGAKSTSPSRKDFKLLRGIVTRLKKR